MKNKILIISNFFYPEITPRSFRTTELAKEFSRQGYEVTVLLPYKSFDYREFSEKHSLNIQYLSKSEIKIELPRGYSFWKRAYRFLYYKLIFFFEYPFIKYLYQLPRWFKMNKEHFNMIISIAYPHPLHWGVSWSKLNCDLWVADCGDPYMGDQVSKHPIYFFLFENYFLKKADFITVPLEAAIVKYNFKYHRKFRVIPQGFTFPKKPFMKTRKNEIPTFAYSGSFYKGYREPIDFFNFLVNIETDFCFVLYANLPSTLLKYIDKLKTKIVLKDPIPREQLLEELSQMDFLINFENPNEQQSPSKLIDYSIANRPILSMSSECTRDDFYKFENFIQGNYDNKYYLKDIEKYNIKNVAQSFVRLLK